jgi:O-antigen ligase
MFNYFNNLRKFTLYEWILFLFPFSQVMGSFFVNAFLIFASLLFIYEVIKNKFFYKINLGWINIYVVFIFYNFFRGFFAIDSLAAIENSFAQLRFLFFALFIYLFIKNKINIKLMISGWTVLILFVCFDSIYQYFFLKDIFGYEIIKGYPTGSIRLTGPFGDEPIVGAFITYTSIPIIFYYTNKLRELSSLKKFLLILVYLFLLLTITLSGERLAFLIFVASTILIFIFYLNFRKIIFFLCLIFLFVLGTYFKNETFRVRTHDLTNILSNFYDSSYGRLYESSFLLFEKNYIFGTGLKNYRVVCNNQIDPRPHSLYQFCSTHPHNFYLEILTESGLVGFVMFTIGCFYFFKFVRREINNNSNFKNYSAIAYGNILILLIYFWPLKTSGSFFTTWNGSFFWFNLGVLLLMTRKQ